MDNPPATETLVNSDGTFTDQYYSQFEEADRPTIQRFKNAQDQGKSYLEVRRKLGVDPNRLVEIPDDNSTDTVRANFRQKALGVSDKDEDYGYELSEDDKALMGDIPPERRKEILDIARNKLDLSPAKFRIMMDAWKDFVIGDTKEFDRQFEERKALEFDLADKELNRKFGDSLTERKRNVDALTFHYHGREFIKKHNLENDPDLFMFLNEIADDLGEGKLKGLTAPTAPTPDQVQAKVQEIRSHPGYMDKRHPEHKRLQQEVIDLLKRK